MTALRPVLVTCRSESFFSLAAHYGRRRDAQVAAHSLLFGCVRVQDDTFIRKNGPVFVQPVSVAVTIRVDRQCSPRWLPLCQVVTGSRSISATCRSRPGSNPKGLDWHPKLSRPSGAPTGPSRSTCCTLHCSGSAHKSSLVSPFLRTSAVVCNPCGIW